MEAKVTGPDRPVSGLKALELGTRIHQAMESGIPGIQALKASQELMKLSKNMNQWANVNWGLSQHGDIVIEYGAILSNGEFERAIGNVRVKPDGSLVRGYCL